MSQNQYNDIKKIPRFKIVLCRLSWCAGFAFFIARVFFIMTQENFNGGWIKIHRSILKHWIYENPLYLKGWLTILIEVNFTEKTVLIDGELIKCGRGQSLYSLNTWVSKLGKGWTMQKIRTFLKLLESDGMIELEGMRKSTRLTVCNYESYQDGQQTDNKQITNRQQADNKQITTTKECKEGKELKKDKNVFLEKSEFINLLSITDINDSNKDNIIRFFDFRIESGRPFKTASSVRAFLDQLFEFTDMDEDKVRKVIERAIAGGFTNIVQLND